MATNTTYNYEHFRHQLYDLATFDGPRVGEPFPDLVVTTVTGEPCHLRDLHRDRTLVVEAGSATCPMYAKNVPAMADLAARHPESTFVVLYVREAHPGGRLGPHQWADQKRSAAASLPSLHHERRLVLVDDVAGTAHRRLGLLPNLVYVVGPDGLVRFRGDWNDPATVATVLDGTATDSDLRQEHHPPARPGPSTALRTLLAGGWRAVMEFAINLPGLLGQHRRADRQHRLDSGRESSTAGDPVESIAR